MSGMTFRAFFPGKTNVLLKAHSQPSQQIPAFTVAPHKWHLQAVITTEF
jgi:hypothetical protein